MPARTSLPIDLSRSPFPVRAAIKQGIRPGRLRGADLDRPFWGVRTPAGTASTVLGLATAYLSRSAADHVISHTSAALIWGMPLPPRLRFDQRLHVSVSSERRAPRGRGVRGHRLQFTTGDVTAIGPILITTQARTWCDLAAMLDEEELVSVGDFLLWRRRDNSARLSPDDLLACLARFPGRRGLPVLHSSLPVLTDRADSPPESKIRVRMIRAGLPWPDVNPELYDARGHFLAMPDLAFTRYFMAIDYEGDHHRTDPEQWAKDIGRVPRLQDAGWHHTRVSKEDLRDSGELINRLARLVRERG